MSNYKHDCDCGRVIERDPVTKNALHKLDGAPVCVRCHRLQIAYECCSNRGPTQAELRHAVPTVLGGLPYVTLGKP